jgi:hypothetical protein
MLTLCLQKVKNNAKYMKTKKKNRVSVFNVGKNTLLTSPTIFRSPPTSQFSPPLFCAIKIYMFLESLPIFLSHADKCNPFLVALQILSRPIKMHQVAVLLLLLLNGHISTGLPDVIRIGEYKIIASLPINHTQKLSPEILDEFLMKSVTFASSENLFRILRRHAKILLVTHAALHKQTRECRSGPFFIRAHLALSLLLKGTR